MTTANIKPYRSPFQTSPHCQKITGMILKVSAIGAVAAAAIALYVGSLVAVVMATATAIVSAWAAKRISVLPSPLSKPDSNPPENVIVIKQPPTPDIPPPPPPPVQEVPPPVPTTIPPPPPMDFRLPPPVDDSPEVHPIPYKLKKTDRAEKGAPLPVMGELEARLAVRQLEQQKKAEEEKVRLKKEAEEKRKAEEADQKAKAEKEAEDQRKNEEAAKAARLEKLVQEKREADAAAAKIAQETAEKAKQVAAQVSARSAEEAKRAKWEACAEAPLPPRPQRLPAALALGIASAQLKRVEKEKKSATPLQVPKPAEESWSASSTLSDKNKLDLDGVDAERIKRKIAAELLSAGPN